MRKACKADQRNVTSSLTNNDRARYIRFTSLFQADSATSEEVVRNEVKRRRVERPIDTGEVLYENRPTCPRARLAPARERYQAPPSL